MSDRECPAASAATWATAFSCGCVTVAFPTTAAVPTGVTSAARSTICAARRSPRSGARVSGPLDDDVGVVEGGGVSGDVVWVAGEDLGGAAVWRQVMSNIFRHHS